MLGQTVQRSIERLVRHALPDQSPILRLLGAELVAQHRQAHGAGAADQARQRERAAGVGDEPQPAERLNEAGRCLGNDNIAGESQVGARPGRHAVHTHHDGHGQGVQAAHQRRVELVDGLAQVGRRAVGGRLALAQVLAGAEAAARAGQHQHARAFRFNAGQGVGHLAMHIGGEAVQFVGAVQRQARDAAGQVELNVLVGHVSYP
ncbi:hypothetical protein D9M68_776770 [compost metagenome]